jgi:hypothetical protein
MLTVMQIQITVREEDEATLHALAERQWRSEQQQACALLEQVLRAEKARTDPNRRTRGASRRSNGIARSNGAVRVEA